MTDEDRDFWGHVLVWSSIVFLIALCIICDEC